MFELKRTQARAAFKDLLGQANHFLITILVGLDGVRRGVVGINDEFRTSWNPRDVRRSVDRSRIFALDLALIRAVDALDTYMMTSRRRPCALPNAAFLDRMDRSGQKISKRLDAFTEFLPPLPSAKLALLKLAIDWRNRRVHSLAEDFLSRDLLDTILEAENEFRIRHRGLEVTGLVARYQVGDAPTFKEAASIITLTHDAVAHFDSNLLIQLDIEQYVKEALAIALAGPGRPPEATLRHASRKIWGGPKKAIKVVRALRLAGVHETSEITMREVPDAFVDSLVAMQSDQAYDFLAS